MFKVGLKIRLLPSAFKVITKKNGAMLVDVVQVPLLLTLNILLNTKQ